MDTHSWIIFIDLVNFVKQKPSIATLWFNYKKTFKLYTQRNVKEKNYFEMHLNLLFQVLK